MSRVTAALRELELPDKTAADQAAQAVAELNEVQYQDLGDPEINARVAQYEMAYRMQTSVPEAMDVAGESQSTFELYGPEARQPGTFAANCLLARRLAERDVRFIQLYHPGWDHHGSDAAFAVARLKSANDARAAARMQNAKI